MLNALASRIMSGIMAVSMAATPLSANDIANSRYYGTYINGIGNCKIVIEESQGCKFNDVHCEADKTKGYVTTNYTREYTISSHKFSATYYEIWFALSRIDGKKRKTGIFVFQGTEETRNDSTAPRRIYIYITNGATYWKDTPVG